MRTRVCKAAYSCNQTNVLGVNFRDSSRHFDYYATWYVNGKQKHKCFSITKYGEKEAFRLACEYRLKMISQLNTGE